MIIDRDILKSSESAVNSELESNLSLDINQYTLVALTEANNQLIIEMQESYLAESNKNKITFDKILNSIVELFIKIIKGIVNKFLSFLVYIASAGKTFDLSIRTQINKIRAYSQEITIPNAYRFTHLDADDDFLIELKNHFSSTSKKYEDKINSAISKNNFALFKEEMNSGELSIDVNEAISNFRRWILSSAHNEFGKNAYDPDEKISASQFNEECYRYFRDGSEGSPGDAVFDGSGIYEYFYVPYQDTGKLERLCKKDERLINKSAEAAKKEINKFNVSTDKFSDQDTLSVNDFIIATKKNICTIFNEECKDVSIFFSNKLQAYKDQYIQCRRVLTIAMREVVKIQ